MRSKNIGRYIKRWNYTYTVINENYQEAAFIDYRYIENNDPEADIFSTDEGYTFVYGNEKIAFKTVNYVYMHLGADLHR